MFVTYIIGIFKCISARLRGNTLTSLSNVLSLTTVRWLGLGSTIDLLEPLSSNLYLLISPFQLFLRETCPRGNRTVAQVVRSLSQGLLIRPIA